MAPDISAKFIALIEIIDGFKFFIPIAYFRNKVKQ